MKTQRWIIGVLCLIMAIAQLAAPIEAVQAEAVHDETAVLDQMANSWLDTCEANLENCQKGLALYVLGQPSEENRDAIKKQFFGDILTGYQGTSTIQCDLNVEDLYKEFVSPNSLKSDIDTYLNTSADAENSEERLLHLQAQNSIYDIVKNGEIAEDVSVMDVIKENYALFIGAIGCESAIDCFHEALAAGDLATKREKMLTGAILATIACEMSIEDTDALVKNEGMDADELMTEIAQTGIDLVSEIVPQIGVTYEVITVTADVGIKVLSMADKIDALAGFMESPESIETDMSAYYDALSNQYGLYTFEISEFEVTMDEYNGYLVKGDDYEKVVVPETVYGFPVTGFSGCFAEELDITEITIPSGVTSRELTHVVNNCDSLETVYYNAVACEGWYLGSFFYGCDSDFEVKFGTGVTVIPERFIVDCGVSSIAFPEGITTMHSGALMNCAQLKTVTIPSTVTLFDISFDDPAVIDTCENLELAYYHAIDAAGSYYNAIFAHCGNEAQEMSLVLGGEVKATPSTFLIDCGVSSVTFPEGMTLIRDYAISRCDRLETITIPSTVTKFSDNSVCDSIFSKCDSLKTVNYNAKNAAGYLVPLFDNIQSDFTVNFGEGITQIPERFVSNCAITSIAFPEGVTTICDNCLVNCDSLEYVTVPSTVATIEYNLVSDCENIDTIYFNANCTTQPNSAMINNCGDPDDPRMKVVLGDNVTTIPGHFMESCGIAAFTVPQGVTTIGKYAFYKCTGLTGIIIPGSVSSIGASAFYNCTGLTSVTYCGTPVQWCAISISSGNGKLQDADRSYHSWSQASDTAAGRCLICGDTESHYWVLTADADVTYSMTADLYIDLNGYDLSGTLTTNGYRIYGMDSKTDKYTCDGIGYFSCVDENGNAIVPQTHFRSDVTGAVKRYMTIATNHGYTFHRFYLGITHISLAPTVTGLGYKAVFCADDMVIAQLDAEGAYGFSLRLDGNNAVTRYKDRDSFVSGKTVTLRLNHFDVESCGETPLYAAVMLQLSDGTVITSEETSVTMRSVLETINANDSDYTAAQLAAVKAMIEKYAIIRYWDTGNLYA